MRKLIRLSIKTS